MQSVHWQSSVQKASSEPCLVEAAASRPLRVSLTTTAAGVLYDNPLINKATFIPRLNLALV